MADDSIAVVDLDDCKPEQCNYECAEFCPPNKNGKDCIVTRNERFESEDEYDGKPAQVSISEDICLGESCGICVTKCPFDAIDIVNLPDELDECPVHRYGENTFALYGLPSPEAGSVTGILGPNGIGKTTAVRILSGQVTPNLGQFDADVEMSDVVEQYRGTAVQDYLTALSDGTVSVSTKPQYVRRIPTQYDATVRQLLLKADDRDTVDRLTSRLSISSVLDQHIDTLSGGELQRVALAACLAKSADFYFIDEMTPYMDVSQRVNAARLVREVAASQDASVLAVEHDLAILDLLCDRVNIAYGEEGTFGVMSPPIPTRTAINEYLEGYIQSDNMRIREDQITFQNPSVQSNTDTKPLVSYDSFTKSYDGFELSCGGGTIQQGEILGAVGPNGIGKSTFVEILAGDVEPTTGTVDIELTISHKPQYISVEQPIRVDAFLKSTTERFNSSYWNSTIAEPLELEELYSNFLTDLSGGEQQRVAVGAALSQDADLYIFDEPTAHLDVERRVTVADTIQSHMERTDSTAIVVEHDMYIIDLMSDRLLVFDGAPSETGEVGSPQSLEQGMNTFLKNIDITFRRDTQTNRPRINKPDSQKDTQQRDENNYYYSM